MAPNTKWIQYVGEEEYHSTDTGNENRSLDLVPGQAAEVSADKAEQVARDFPDWFLVSDNEPEPVSAPETGDDGDSTQEPPAGGDGPETPGDGDGAGDGSMPVEEVRAKLLEQSRKDLNVIAAGLMVEAPETLANKDAVVDAILAAGAAAAGDQE